MKKIIATKLALIIGITMIVILILNLLIQKEGAIEHFKANGILMVEQIDKVLERNEQEILKKHEVRYLLSQMPVSNEMTYYVVNKNKMTIHGCSDRTLLGKDIRLLTGRWVIGEPMQSTMGSEDYFYIESREDFYVVVSQPEEVVFSNLKSNMWQLIVYLSVAAYVMISMSMSMIERYVIRDVDSIMKGVKDITGGKLETVVKVKGTSELKVLSENINQMTGSLLDHTIKIAKILDAVDMLLAVYEYGDESEKVFTSGKIGPVLMMSEYEIQELLKDKKLFEQKIDSIKQYPVEGFKKVYRLPVETECYLQIETFRSQQMEFGVIFDVTEEIVDKQRLKRERDYDLLTGLLTRRAFYQKIRELYQKPELIKNAVLMMCDLDGLKQFNDVYGHANGDKALKKAAEILSCVSRKECYIARLSGDEYAIFLYGAQQDDLLMHNLQEIYDCMMKAQIEVYGKNIDVRLSGGYVLYSKFPEELDQLLTKADCALYESKENGRARFTEYTEG